MKLFNFICNLCAIITLTVLGAMFLGTFAMFWYYDPWTMAILCGSVAFVFCTWVGLIRWAAKA